ncbi:MAG: FHA domain-containing protein [Polyangiaceae bacterium]
MSAHEQGFGAAPNAPFWLVSELRSVGLIPGRYVLGRAADADIQLADDPNVSRRHVRLVVSNDAVEIEDLGSSNGTWLDGKLVQHPLRMPVGGKLRVGAEEFELRRLRPPRRRRQSATTSPEIPLGRSVVAADDDETSTREDTPVDMVYDQVIGLLDARRVDDARRFVDPLLGLLELGHRPLQAAALDRVGILTLRLAEVSGEGRYVDWIINEHRRRGRLVSSTTAELLERVLFAGVPVDGLGLESYLSLVSELGLASGTPGDELVRRIRGASAQRGFTVPSPPPEEH